MDVKTLLKEYAAGRRDFSGADLYDADLEGANLGGANLSGANLYGADLSWANLSGANLTWASLSRANLFEADLTGADLRDANLYGADLRNTILDTNKNASANIEEAAAHLYAALAQSAPSDDEIIIGHIRNALILLGGKNPR